MSENKIAVINSNWKEYGFTLVELLLVILLIGIIGATTYPLLRHHQVFQTRFFMNEMLSMLHYAHQVATSTGCEVQVGFKSQEEIALFQRKQCTHDGFTQMVLSPSLLSDQGAIVPIPRSITVSGDLPLYIDNEGKVYNKSHRWQKELTITIKDQQIAIDGFSGFSYEK